MPTTTNPVSSVPVSNASQSKSLRSRLGFGGNTNKPSFFTQLNLKPSRRSFTMQPENESSQEKTILLIGTNTGNDGSRSMSMHNSAKNSFNSLSRATTMHSRIPQLKLAHEGSSIELPRFSNFRVQFDSPVAESPSLSLPKTQLNAQPNDSATSKDLPNLSNDLSLLIDEPCPSGPVLSRRNSQESAVRISDTYISGSYSKDNSENLNSPPLPSSHSVRTSIETNDSRLHEFGADDSFDLSKARVSLESMKEEPKDRWTQDMIVQDSSTDKSALSLDISDVFLYLNPSGPITSTPYINRKASPSQVHQELSFDLDSLDPDLIAFLRPNSFQQTLDRVSTPAGKRFHQSTNLPPVRTSSAKPVISDLESPPVSPSRFRFETNSPTARRFSKTITTLPSSPSPSRPEHASRFQVSQQQTPAFSHAPKPTIVLDRIPWLDSPESDTGQVSSGPSTVSSSNLATPLDGFKPMVPHLPTMVNEYRPEPFVINRSSYNNSKIGKVQTLTQSSLSSSFDPLSNPRFGLKTIDVQLASSLPLNETSEDVGMPRVPYPRNQTLYTVQNERCRPSSADPNHSNRSRGNSSAGISANNERSVFESRRYRKRSMSVDQSPDLSQLRHHGSSGTASTHGALYTYKPSSARQFSYDGKIPNNEDHGRHEDVGGERERERQSRLSPEWLGPKTVKAFAAAGLLSETREADRRISHARSISEYKIPAIHNHRDRFSADGSSPLENERDRDIARYSSSSRFGDYRASGLRSGAATPNINGSSSSRPLSRADSLSKAPLFVRTISDLVSGRGSMEGRDSLGSSGSYHRTISAYSMTGGTRSESTGSGGRLSPTTTSSHITVQSQLQSMKEKYDSQTEALLAALADSQKSCRELRAENGSLKGHVKELEERLIEAIASVKQKEKELARARRLYTNDRSRMMNGKHPHINNLQSQAQVQLSRSQLASTVSRSVSPPKARRFSNGSSIFPTIPNTMALLMAETPDGTAAASSPPPGSSGSGTSPPPSPTLVLPKLIPESTVIKTIDNCNTSSPITITHRRSTSITSLATSANFSIKSGSPGSLKLKPEHEFLLGDLTQLSFHTGSGTESEVER